MTDYVFDSVVALDPNSDPAKLVKSAAGQVYAADDKTLTTPLTVTDRNGVTKTTVNANDIGVIETFIVTDQPQVWWYGAGVALLITSDMALLQQATAAAVSASAAQTAAENAAALAAAAPSLLPDGGNVGDVLVKTGDRQGEWAPAPSGTGGTAFTAYAQVAALAGYPVSFPPSTHTHPSAQISDSTAAGRAVLSAADFPTILSKIGAAPASTVSFPGFGTTAGVAAQGNHAHAAQVITLAAIAGLASTDVQSAIAELANRPSGGSGSAPAGTVVAVDYNFTTSTWPTRPTGLPTGAVVRWRGPSQPTIGGLYAVAGLDEYLLKTA